jgi:hypothetical protein
MLAVQSGVYVTYPHVSDFRYIKVVSQASFYFNFVGKFWKCRSIYSI